MSDRVVLITGAAGGIGRATAQVFADDGWRVVGVDLEEGDADTFDRFVEADVGDAESSKRLFDSVNEHEGRLDALINNAAIQLCKPVVETEAAEWDRTMATNLRSVFLAARNAHPLLQGGGAIVNVSSVHAVATSANIAAYATSKGGMLTFTRSLAIEFASSDIRVNAVLPGAVDTAMLRDGLQRGHAGGGTIEERVEALGDEHVLGRVGQPSEIAEAILFLADGERSSFVTGQTLTVDGGAMARLSTE